MCKLLDVDNVFLLAIVVRGESSFDFLIYLVRPLQAFRALYMIYRLKSRNQYLKSGDCGACPLRAINGDYRASVVRTCITIYIRSCSDWPITDVSQRVI